MTERPPSAPSPVVGPHTCPCVDCQRVYREYLVRKAAHHYGYCTLSPDHDGPCGPSANGDAQGVDDGPPSPGVVAQSAPSSPGQECAPDGGHRFSCRYGYAPCASANSRTSTHVGESQL